MSFICASCDFYPFRDKCIIALATKNVNRILQTCLENKTGESGNIYNKEEALIWKSSERDVMIGESGNSGSENLELGVQKSSALPRKHCIFAVLRA